MPCGGASSNSVIEHHQHQRRSTNGGAATASIPLTGLISLIANKAIRPYNQLDYNGIFP